MQVKHLDHLNLSVRSFKESAEWYNRVFGFTVVEEGLYKNRPWGVLRCGEAMLCIYENPEREYIDGDALSEKGLHGVNHFALRIVDPLKWQETIKQEGIAVEYGGAWEWPNSTSWYINDPTGYSIEVVAWNDDQIKFKSL